MMRTSSPNSNLGSIFLIHCDGTDRHELHLRFVHMEYLEDFLGQRVGFHKILVRLLQCCDIHCTLGCLISRHHRFAEVVVKALQDVQTIHMHHRRIVFNPKVVQKIFGGNQLLHCLVQCQFVHHALLCIISSLFIAWCSTSSSALPPMRSLLSSSTSFSSMACPISKYPRRRLM